MPTAKPSPKTAPKTQSPKTPTGKRRLSRAPENYPQSGAPLPPPIEGAEIVVRVAGMFRRDLTLGQAAELARGLAWAYGAASMHVAVQAGVTGDQVDTLAEEVRRSFEDGQRQVLDVCLREAQKLDAQSAQKESAA